MDWPNFSAIFSEAFGNLSIDEGFLRDLSKTLRLSTLEKISIGLALSESLNLDLRIQGICLLFFVQICEVLYLVIDVKSLCFQDKIFASFRLRNYVQALLPLILMRKFMTL